MATFIIHGDRASPTMENPADAVELIVGRPIRTIVRDDHDRVGGHAAGAVIARDPIEYRAVTALVFSTATRRLRVNSVRRPISKRRASACDECAVQTVADAYVARYESDVEAAFEERFCNAHRFVVADIIDDERSDRTTSAR